MGQRKPQAAQRKSQKEAKLPAGQQKLQEIIVQRELQRTAEDEMVKPQQGAVLNAVNIFVGKIQILSPLEGIIRASFKSATSVIIVIYNNLGRLVGMLTTDSG